MRIKTKVLIAMICTIGFCVSFFQLLALFAIFFPKNTIVGKLLESPLASAQKRCVPLGSVYSTIGDNGKSLIIKTEGTEEAGIRYTQLECFLEQLKVSDAVKAEIETTRAIDGKQNADWDKYHATWSYHPDKGVRMVITLTN